MVFSIFHIIFMCVQRKKSLARKEVLNCFYSLYICLLSSALFSMVNVVYVALYGKYSDDLSNLIGFSSGLALTVFGALIVGILKCLYFKHKSAHDHQRHLHDYVQII